MVAGICVPENILNKIQTRFKFNSKLKYRKSFCNKVFFVINKSRNDTTS